MQLLSSKTFQSIRATALVLGVVLVFGYFIFQSEDVRAFRDRKTAHVFATQVQAVGWNAQENARAQELALDATYPLFTESNSAFISVSALQVIQSLVPEVAVQPEATTTEVVPAPEETPTENVSDEIQENETAPEPEISPTQPEVLPEQNEGTSVEQAPIEPTPATPTPEPTSWIRALESLIAATAHVAYATTTEEVVEPTKTSTPETLPRSVADHVASCTVVDESCYVLELSGFGVEGTLSESTLRAAQLVFSFAYSVDTPDVVDEKLRVRYLLDGQWKSAGDIYLNKELSNAANGSYFTAELPDVDAWSDLQDIVVSFEYERSGARAAKVFLDSAWIDAEYRDTGSGSDITSDLVSGELATSTVLAQKSLTLSDGVVIEFPYVDDIDEDSLVMRTNRAEYIAAHGIEKSQEVYVSVKNDGSVPDSFKLFAAFPEGKGSVREISQMLRNVPGQEQVPQYEDVAYFCEGGWQERAGRGHMCASSLEVQQCAEVNTDGNNCLVRSVQVSVEARAVYTDSWVPKTETITGADIESMGVLPAGFKPGSRTESSFTILPQQTIYFRLLLDSPHNELQQFVLQAQGDRFSGDIDSSLLALESEWQVRAEEETKRDQKRINERKSARKSFDADELPQFKFKFKSQRPGIVRAFNRITGRENKFAVEKAEIAHETGESREMPIAVTYGEDGEWSMKFTKQPRAIRPGKYTMDITIREAGNTYHDSVEFFWGVIAVNTNKTIYEQGETAELSLGVIDDAGNTICNAITKLEVTNPEGNTQELTVTPSGTCGANNVIDIPDYSAQYQAGSLGRYSISFEHYTEDRVLLHRVTDFFEVREKAAFVVERTGPTRIYPKAPYTMTLRITANEQFEGVITESVPNGTILTETGGAQLNAFSDTIHMHWNLSLAKGETRTISYVFDAPDISPYLYLFGPLTLKEKEVTVFEELRTWKVASDALGSYIEKSSSWSATVSGSWEVKSLAGSPFNVPANAVAEIAIVNSDINDEVTGGVRHASSSLTRSFLIHEAESQGTTPTVMHVQMSATSSLQTFASDSAQISFVLLGYWTDGYFVERFQQIDPGITNNTWGDIALSGFGVASGTIAEMVLGNWDAGAEQNAGVRRDGSSLSRLANIHESEAGGVNTATMFVKASGTSATIEGFAQTEGANDASVDYWLTGFWSVNPTGLDYQERFDDLGGPTSASTWTDRALDSFGVQSSGIAEILFANAADANLSMLIGVRTNGSSIDRTQNIHEAEAGGWSIGRAHVKADATASSTIEYFTDDTGNDQFRLLGYWYAADLPPNAPTLHDVLFESEKTGTSTPKFNFTASDPDGTDTLVYQFQWDDDSILDTAPLGDRTSDVETGCSPNCFANTVSGGDTSPFNEGEKIQFHIQTPLVSGTTYYWRVRATETGSSISSEWSPTYSFTYVADTDPSQWMQTQDTQFDQGTLSGTETFGSNAVRLSTTPPTGAMLVYGEGTVQTPRYRLWSGTAWGSENPGGTPQSVGGTIQWMVAKAGVTRNEYIVATQDDQSDVNVQIYNGTSTAWAYLTELTTTISDTSARGFDITVESSSGDAMVVYCDGDADPSYRIWNGSNWSSPAGTINLSSANNCEWIELASDPESDEIILVARDTGAQYEAIVWDGALWTTNSQVLGSMTDVAHEGIAVEYEESGDDALVVVSNADNANFTWTSWDGDTQTWNPPATQTIGNDFEWGELARDVGTDRLGLCYADQDDDLGTLIWDGDGWATFVAATNEYEAAGTTNNRAGSGTVEGKPFSCQFETTTGRDGYLMAAYSDNTAARYQFWNGSSHSGESSVSTVQDSWTVYSARTGDGKLLTAYHDDINARYDVSSWDGSAWATAVTIENTPSVTAAPFREPISIAAQVYQAQTGTITSDTIDFDVVPTRPSWGEILWNTTEAVGTDVSVQVYYESGGVCGTIVPDVAIPGNSTGFQASASPLDISSISTSTYNRICLKATLSSTNTSVPTLNDWSLSWERQPFLTQSHFRWYANTNANTPTDVWPTGATDINEDESIGSTYAPSPGNVLRLRSALLVENVALSSGSLLLKLQYASGSSCSASMTWLDVGAIGSTTAAWRGYNNAAVSDGATLAARVLSTTDVSATYEEENNSSSNPASASVTQELEYDWVLEHNATAGTNYCFRAITAQGEVLNSYDFYPSVFTNSKPSAPIQEKLFDNEQTASTTPWFEFVSDDPESNDMTYQVQIDDDYAFGSINIDRDSQTHFTEFSNIVTPSDKDPFNSGQTVRFIPTSSLTNNTTYYWRVRAKDRNNSNTWSDWSSIRSMTIDTSTTITTWFQTTREQFATNNHEDTEATTTGETVLTPPQTTGTSSATAIDFDSRSTGNAWGTLSWNDTETSGVLTYHIEYLNGSVWSLIPDSDLAGNSTGFNTPSVSLIGLDPTTYNQIRPRANFTQVGVTPRLNSWTVTWASAVGQATTSTLFDNEKTGTTTPIFTFSSDDPQGDDLIYQISWSTDPTFTSSTTRTSNVHAGFSNLASPGDTSPFTENNTIQFWTQPSDALTNNTTYYWRVRAIDPSGGNAWSVWSSRKSFTVDTSVTVSTWFQTTDTQFSSDTLDDTEVTGTGGVQVTSIIREAFVAYAEGTVQAPRAKIWNGATWGTELTGLSVGASIQWLEAAAAPTRDEYIVVTQNSTGRVDAQIYNGQTGVWGNKIQIGTANNTVRRGFDVAYETSSGDAVAVSCNGTEAAYRVWNGSAWDVATSSITLAVSNNCEWVRLASDPASGSDELIGVFRDTTAGAVDYNMQVWNGSSWVGGSSTTTGAQATAANEGIAVEYEESGGDAVVVLGNGAALSAITIKWNGSAWSTAGTIALGSTFAGGRLARDSGSDELALCYIDNTADIGFFEWSGSVWNGTFAEFETLGNSANGRPVSCEFETTAGRDNFVMIPYSDDTQAESVFWNNTTISTPATVISTVTDSWEVRTARTGDGNILAVFYDDSTTEYDFSYWNGTSWSAEEIVETNSIGGAAPFPVPIDLVARRYPSFTTGQLTSTEIDFDDGSGPKWEQASWSDITTGGSDILYQVEYFASTSEWALIPNSEITNNSIGTTTSPIDLSNLSRTTYNQIRLKANLSCGASCPTIQDWTVKWSEGIRVSGTAQEFDQSTNMTSGTVALAVNGTLQTGKTATISGGAWQITNVTAFEGDVITVWIDGAAENSEAVGVTKYDGTGDVTSIPLYGRHLTLGSNDNQIVTNANLALYDNSVSGDEDIFHDVDAGNDLVVCSASAAPGCFNSELFVKSGTTFRPDSASSGSVTMRHFENNGTTTPDGNTFFVSGSWDNNNNFAKDSSTITFTATSTTETIDSTGAATSTFNNVTFGQTSGTATWNLSSNLDVDGATSIQFGTLNQGVRFITLGGNLTFGSSGVFTKGSASTTFDGTGTSIWTDNTVAKQNMGEVWIDGSTKTVQLGAAAKVTNLIIGANDTFTVDNNYALEVGGSWVNNNSFLAQNGTVTFTSTTAGNTITAGSSNFYNLTFNGVGGNWSFVGSTLTLGNNFTIATGTVTMPTATTTIAGNFSNTGGTFAHNNGVINMTAGSAKTVTTNGSSFYDLTFNNASGSWSFTETNATSSRHVTVTAGTLTAPSNVFAVGGSFWKNGGTFTHNSGTLRFTASSAQTLKFGNSDTRNLTFAGAGSWSFLDAAATTTNTVRFEAGTLTLPTTVFVVGGSWQSVGGTFAHNSGTVKFNSIDTGETVNPGAASFSQLLFDSGTGGWTITNSATSTATTSLSNAGAFAVSSGQSLAVLGHFNNAVGGASTTWTGSTLFINNGASTTVNTKTTGGDTYGTLLVGATTDLKFWNSSVDLVSVMSGGSITSQDHAAVDGDLYLWGEYIGTGTDYWNYATDFDGTALGGSSRQVNVRLAANATVARSSGALNIVGVAGATTTIANQGSGTYGITLSGGTLNAQYYSLQNLNSTGLSLSGTPTITSLSNGDYELAVNTGSLMTIAGTVIDANPALQIQSNRFATTTAITGTNVTVTGSPSSYWWWRNHIGNLDGEAFDSDPTGDPGNARWDDSSFVITVSGSVYSDHGGTAIGTPCDGSTPVVRVVVHGGAAFTGSCNAGTGAFSIPNVAFIGDVVVTTYLNTNGGKRAVSVTKTPTGNISGLPLYENALIVSHEDLSPITIEDLATYDSTHDSDIFFDAATTSTDTLTTEPNTELYVWTGKTFAPNGNVTLQSGGSGSYKDGTLYLAANSTFTASTTETHAIGGQFIASTSVTFTPAQSTFTFTATTTGKAISASPALSFYNLIFNGVNGGWNLLSSATTTVQNTFSIATGTLSGTGNMLVSSGDIIGNGTVSMAGGTIQLVGAGTFGNHESWQFNNLILGSGTSAVSAKVGTGTTTIAGVLSVAGSQTFEAGSSTMRFTGAGTPFVVTGTFTVQTAPFYFIATSATTIADEDYKLLVLAPSGVGSPTFTLRGGTMTAETLIVGDGTNTVTVNANTNDPSLTIADNVTINTNAALVASNVGAFDVAGSWSNAGVFTHSSSTVRFNSTDVGETINPGNSSFHNLTFDNVSGGWTLTQNATSTGNLSLTNASAFTLSSGRSLAVNGTFTNSVGGAATTWSGSTLFLNSQTNYTINTKTTGGDTYGTLLVATSTDIRMWNSTADTTVVDSTGSLYSQDHANVDGSLYIYGDYARSSGSDYWSYATDFDGASLSGSERQVNVRIASSSVLSISGGVFDILGSSAATTTIANQGAGRYAFSVSGGTMNAQYYQLRDTNQNGLALSGSPTITSLSRGDYELSFNGGTMLTVAGSVITANPLKVFTANTFATSTGITSGSNVLATGSTASSWKFNLHYGNYASEAYDSDPAGDPGYIRWDDSASNIIISGNVYSDEGVTVSTECDGSTPRVVLKVQGSGSYAVPCNASTGAYSISNVSFNPGDVLTVFLDTAGGAKAANVSVDPITNITDMHLYHNRVIVRHEDTAPLTIAHMSVYDSSDDSDIPFTAVDAGTDTLALPPNTKLIVWNNKTFAPAGNMTLESGGSGSAWDGSLAVLSGGALTLSGAQTHSVGGSFELSSGAAFTPANSTITFTATTTGKTVAQQSSSFYNIVFNGTGGNWAFSGGASSTNDFTITSGTVTLSSATTTVGSSFQNNGGTFMHNNGLLLLTATTSGKTVRANGSNFYNLSFEGTGGTWSFADTHATTSQAFNISAGTVTLPSGVFAVGTSYTNSGTFAHNNGTVKLTSTAVGRTITPNTSAFYNLLVDGVGGAWTFTGTNATTTHSFTLTNGSTTLPTGIFAVGGSFTASSSAIFNHNSGTVKMTATTTGKLIAATSSSFYNLLLSSSAGGWTMTESATTTNAMTLTNASAFTLSSGRSLAVNGTFTNSVGGAATTWSGSTLFLNSQTNYTINTKTTGGDTYGTLLVATSTDIRMWNSTADTTVVDSTGSLYSQDHANVDGSLYIYGDYARSSGSDYWSYATDFDGTALGGSSRQVNVRVATSSVIAYSNTASLAVVGTASATSTVRLYGSTGTYSLSLSGGSLNAQYYQLRSLDTNGLNILGTPTITSLSYGDYELGVNGGSMITVAGTALDANASLAIAGTGFSTTTGVSTGYNVTRTGSPANAWTFTGSYGNYDGEAFDSDGVDGCGYIRWSDSSCLFVSQEHYRWRNDDGNGDVPNADWYNASWTKRKKIGITNPNATSYTNIPVKVVVEYDADMQSDFDDLRFTSSNGTTSISYWREKNIASASSTVWVLVSSLPASGSAEVYVYYGNNSAVGADDGDATFGFFDDFEDDNISEYSGNTSMFDVDTDAEYTGSYGLDAGINAENQTTSGIYRTGSLLARGDTLRYFTYVDALTEDEPCTYFGVQGSGQNYAVCLDQYPIERVSLAENVTSNDGSGTIHASTTVAYTTGWYEVVVNWLTSTLIDVYVYDSVGSLFANVTTTDSSYSSGGVGFGYWAQHGSWDTMMSMPYAASAPTFIFGVEQGKDGATWKAAEDTILSGQTQSTPVRLRFSVQNTGAPLFGQLFTLQYASKGSALNCESVSTGSFANVPVAASCGSSPVCMTTTSHYADGASTGGLLSYPANLNFDAGKLIEDPSNATASSSVRSYAATEIEYAFQFTTNATGNAYCLRTTNAGAALDNYARVAEVRLLQAPTISNFTLNMLSDIALTEGATTTVMATGTVTDLNGYADIISASSSIARSGAGTLCSANDNNCYQQSCSLSSCSGNSCTVSCSADIFYFADPTDTGSTYAAQNWLANLRIIDSTNQVASTTAPSVELLTLYGLSVSQSGIDFDALSAGQNSGAVNEQTTILNTGNSLIDIDLSGTDLAGTASTIGVGELKFATSTFSYASCSICSFLTGTASQYDLDIPKTTASTTTSGDDVFWGINVPNGTKAVLHTGTNTFTARSP